MSTSRTSFEPEIPGLPKNIDLELTNREKKEVAERIRPRVAILHETIRAEGEMELHRPVSALAWSALAAGSSMGFSLVTMGLARAMLPDAPWRPLVVQLGYAVGFLIVIIGRQQLFTENTMTPVIPLLQNADRPTLCRVLRLWGIVLAGNLVGTAVFAFAVARLPVFRPEVKDAFAAIGREALEGGFGVHFAKAIFSGWLIALLVWMLPAAETSRVFLVVGVTYLIGLGGLSHVIAGSVETMYSVVTGDASVTAYLGRFLAPVLLGNLAGGTALVAALAHAQIAAERAAREDDARKAKPG